MGEKHFEHVGKEQNLNKERQIHRNFRKDKDSQVEPSSAERAEENRIRGHGNRYDGMIGEGVSLRIASEKLGLTIADPRFDQKEHGFDGVFWDKGKPVVIESKFSMAGKGALEGDQGQPSWVRRTAMKMQDEKSDLYSKGNAEIAKDILKVGPENLRRILITIDKKELTATVYEGQHDLSWKKITERFSVYDLDQPYLA